MIEIPPINQVTFYEANKVDFRRYYPNMYNSSHKIYIPGIRRNCYLQPFVRGQYLTFQLRSDVQPTVTLHNILTDSEEVITGVDISPTGWTLTTVWEYSKLLTIEGEYYLSTVDSEGIKIISEPFYVSNINKNVTRVTISNDKNDFGYIFTEDDINFKSFDILLNGRNDLMGDGLEIEKFDTDSGGLSTQDAVHIVVDVLELGAMPKYMMRKLTAMLGCRTIIINGLNYQTKEYETPTRDALSNMYSATIPMQLTDDSAGTISTSKVAVVGGDISIIDDNNVAVTDS